jgi:hypothetical protein
MHTVSRLEIMGDSGELHKITKILNRTNGVTYTVIRNVTSHGVCGEADQSGVALENDYIIAFCPTDRAKPLLEQLQPVLNRFGGACFMSEATEVKSMRCVIALS